MAISSSALRLSSRIAMIFIGLVYVVAGAVKAIEPVVFAYEIQAFAEVLVPAIESADAQVWYLYAALLMIAVELLLGLALIINYRSNVTIPLAGIIMLFFIIILISAWDQVENCGCFGSLFDRTPVQSVIEDVIFLGVILLAWFGRRGMPVVHTKLQAYTLLGMFCVAVLAPLYFVQHPNFLAILEEGMDLSQELQEQVSDIRQYALTPLDTTQVDSTVQDTTRYLPLRFHDPVKNEWIFLKLAHYPTAVDTMNLAQGEYLIFLISPTCEHCRASVPVINQLYMMYHAGILPVRVVGLFRSLPPARPEIAAREKDQRQRFRMGRYRDENGNWSQEDRYGLLHESALFPIGYLDRKLHADLARQVPRVFTVSNGIVGHIWDDIPTFADLAEVYPTLNPYLQAFQASNTQ